MMPTATARGQNVGWYFFLSQSSRFVLSQRPHNHMINEVDGFIIVQTVAKSDSDGDVKRRTRFIFYRLAWRDDDDDDIVVSDLSSIVCWLDHDNCV